MHLQEDNAGRRHIGRQRLERFGSVAASCFRDANVPSVSRRVSRSAWLIVSVLFLHWTGPALAQEYGELKSFGAEGKSYSTSQEDGFTREAFLLSQRSYRSEDSFGYDGNVRHIFKYEIGGYEIKFMNYFVRCAGAGELSVRSWELDEQEAKVVIIQDKPPTKSEKEAYNLYWSVCHDKFDWFRVRQNTTSWVQNGSLYYLVAKGSDREFYFDNPRNGLVEVGVTRDTLAFRGTRSGDRYTGTAFVFSKTCGSVGYPVSGAVSADQRTVNLLGKSPLVDAQCQTASLRDATLTFELWRD